MNPERTGRRGQGRVQLSTARRNGCRWRVDVADHVLDRRLLDRQVGTSYAAATAATSGRRWRRRGTRATAAGRRPRTRRPAPRWRAPRRRGRRRGCGSSRRSCSPASAPSKTTVPWSMTITRSQSASMSCRSWVVSISVMPRSALSAAQELAQPPLADHVEPDRRLVEVEDLGVVQERRHDVAAHPLAEAELADRGVEQVARARAARGTPRGCAGSGRADPVDPVHQVEGVAQRQVPPQRGALTEDHADPPRQPLAARSARAPRPAGAPTSAPGSRSAS